MTIIDGNAIAAQIIQELSLKVSGFGSQKPVVLFIRVGDDPASVSYVSKKQKTAAQIGIESKLLVFPEEIKEEVLTEIDEANRNPNIHAILIQAPLPSHINELAVFNKG